MTAAGAPSPLIWLARENAMEQLNRVTRELTAILISHRFEIVSKCTQLQEKVVTPSNGFHATHPVVLRRRHHRRTGVHLDNTNRQRLSISEQALRPRQEEVPSLFHIATLQNLLCMEGSRGNNGGGRLNLYKIQPGISRSCTRATSCGPQVKLRHRAALQFEYRVQDAVGRFIEIIGLRINGARHAKHICAKLECDQFVMPSGLSGFVTTHLSDIDPSGKNGKGPCYQGLPRMNQWIEEDTEYQNERSGNYSCLSLRSRKPFPNRLPHDFPRFSRSSVSGKRYRIAREANQAFDIVVPASGTKVFRERNP